MHVFVLYQKFLLFFTDFVKLFLFWISLLDKPLAFCQLSFATCFGMELKYSKNIILAYNFEFINDVVQIYAFFTRTSSLCHVSLILYASCPLVSQNAKHSTPNAGGNLHFQQKKLKMRKKEKICIKIYPKHVFLSLHHMLVKGFIPRKNRFFHVFRDKNNPRPVFWYKLKKTGFLKNFAANFLLFSFFSFFCWNWRHRPAFGVHSTTCFGGTVFAWRHF